MSAQASRFLLWGTTPVCLERMVTNFDFIEPETENPKAFIKRIGIAAKKKLSILNELDLMGINEKSLFPGLDGIGRYINEHFKVVRSKT